MPTTMLAPPRVLAGGCRRRTSLARACRAGRARPDCPCCDSMMRRWKVQAEHARQVPIILALFTGQGGRMILYRPGTPEVAPPVPVSTSSPSRAGWRHGDLSGRGLRGGMPKESVVACPLQAYRTEPDRPRQPAVSILHRRPYRPPHHPRRNLAFMDACLSKGTRTYDDMQAYIGVTMVVSHRHRLGGRRDVDEGRESGKPQRGTGSRPTRERSLRVAANNIHSVLVQVRWSRRWASTAASERGMRRLGRVMNVLTHHCRPRRRGFFRGASWTSSSAAAAGSDRARMASRGRRLHFRLGHSPTTGPGRPTGNQGRQGRRG